MIDFIRRRPLMSAVLAFVLLLTLLSTRRDRPRNPQGDRRPLRQAGADRQPLSSRASSSARPAPGSPARIPFAENVVWIDKRVLDVDMERQQVLSTDQLRLEVDAFARYRIVDPLRMYIARAHRGPGRARRCARSSARSCATSSASARSRPCSSPEREGVMENVRGGLNRVARQYGAEIIDVRIKKADLPDGTPLQSAYDRMRTAREQEARSIRAEGAKRAQIIRAEADADAVADLCRELRQGRRILRFLPRHAVLPDDVHRRRAGQAVADDDHPVAAERLSEGIHWTLGDRRWFNSRSCA